MIEFLKTGPEGTQRIDAPESGCWINVVAPTEDEKTWLREKAGIVEEFVRSALDDEESSHIDYDDDTEQVLVIVDCPAVEDAAVAEDPAITQYDTQPLAVLLLPEHGMVVTVSLFPNDSIDALASGRVKQMDTRRRTRFLLQLLLHISQRFLVYLRNISKQFTKTERHLRKSMRNLELIKMLGLEKSLLYFSTSLKADEATLLKIKSGRAVRLFEEDQELLDDVFIEINQAIEMNTITTNILTRTMEAYGNVISNNLNNVMRTLTIITVVLAVPTIVFSFYGMNVEVLPLVSTWVWPMLIAVLGSLATAIVIVKTKMFK